MSNVKLEKTLDGRKVIELECSLCDKRNDEWCDDNDDNDDY